LLAGHIAAQLNRPLYVVRLDSSISSLLGDTAKNVRSIFDYVPGREGVLFLDEMDAIAKVRDDRHELGELKRVVNTVIQGLDSLDDRAVVIAATNHPQLLDPAIWRRFPYKAELSAPSADVREEMWRHFLFSDAQAAGEATLLAQLSEGLTGAEIQNLALSARRQAVLDGRAIDGAAVAWATTCSVEGGRALPPRGGLTADQKRQLALSLSKVHGLSVTDTAAWVGVSRPTIYGYLKEESHGD
jgi:SpoVK/Ycf46/Vps4 family AAA+-type ATPase